MLLWVILVSLLVAAVLLFSRSRKPGDACAAKSLSGRYDHSFCNVSSKDDLPVGRAVEVSVVQHLRVEVERYVVCACPDKGVRETLHERPVINTPLVASWVQRYGTPPATLQQLRQANFRAVAARLERVVLRRADADVKAALYGADEMERALAVLYIVVNHFGFIIIGGVVRDVICLGKTSFKDINVEVPQAVWPDKSNWRAVLTRQQADATKKYGVVFAMGVVRSVITTRAPDGVVPFDLHIPGKNKKYEVESITPWNTAYIPCPSMDFTCNNLCIKPGNPDLCLQFPVFMSALDIVKQLCEDPDHPKTSPCRDCEWKAGAGGNDGYGKNLKLVGVNTATSGMDGRIQKMRNKRFIFVEGAYISLLNIVNESIVMFHGTSPSSAQSIIQGGFRPSTQGLNGPGLYLTRDFKLASMFSKGAILRVVIRPGNLVFVKDHNPSGWQQAGVDTGVLMREESNRGYEQWIVRDVAKSVVPASLL